MKVAVTTLCVLWVVLQLLPTPGSGVCCPTHRLNRNRLCDDCRDGTPYCGVGKCNWFGCNCQGGCRRGLCGDNGDEDLLGGGGGRGRGRRGLPAPGRGWLRLPEGMGQAP